MSDATPIPKPEVVARDKTSGSQQSARRPQVVVYLRVSSPSQVNTDYNPEGISIPSQREACTQKCLALGADIVREFVEPGRSATNIERRPVFQEMMAWIRANRNEVDYIVVYHFSRIFRNTIDAAITKKELAKYDIRIVSTLLDMGDSFESDLVETIVNAVDEYQVRRSGADIAFKMGSKARNGGTIGRARLGYVNVRDTSGGRNIGTVVVDDERAPLVRIAFELFSTGDFTLDSLQEEMTDRGLRTRPGRFPAGPISRSKLAAMLRDPYYTGYVTYKGECIPGRHEPLISHELFEAVQKVLDSRSGPGERARRHFHYLKGALWCGRCHQDHVESRMIYTRAKGHGGEYVYFFCRRRQEHACSSKYIDEESIESAMFDVYGSLHFPSDLAERVRMDVHKVMAEESDAVGLLRKQLQSELQRLDTQEENLLDLAATGESAVTKIKARLSKIQQKRALLVERLENTDTKLQVGYDLIDVALTLLDRPLDTYLRMNEDQRRLMNQALFEKLYVMDGEVVDLVFNAPFEDLDEAKAVIQWTYNRRKLAAKDFIQFDPNKAGQTWTLSNAILAVGSNKRVMVGAAGLEPTTCWL